MNPSETDDTSSPHAGRSGWLAFWNGDHPVYVNARHRDAHYRRVAQDILETLQGGRPVVLDFGCGEALHAERVAERCARLYLYEAAATVRDKLARRYAGRPAISVVGPGGLEGLDSGSLDLIVVNSVIQYLHRAELESLLVFWLRLLKDDGALILADVVPPDTSPVADLFALLAFARRERFFFAAVLGTLRTLGSGYVRTRRQHGFSRYREDEMLAMLAAAGYRAERRARNFGINPRRMTFVARPQGPCPAVTP